MSRRHGAKIIKTADSRSSPALAFIPASPCTGLQQDVPSVPSVRNVAALMLVVTATLWMPVQSALAAEPAKSTATSSTAQARPAEPVADPALQAALTQHQQRLRDLDVKLRQVHDEIRVEREKLSRVHDQIRSLREKELARR